MQHKELSAPQVDEYGNVEWVIPSTKCVKYHRVNGPAVEYITGSKFWYINNKLHRSNGPAVELINGCKSCYSNGKLHRNDGPAVEQPNGKYYWAINGKKYFNVNHFCKAAGICDEEKTLFLLKWCK